MAEVNIRGLPPHSRSLRINKGGLTLKQDLIKDVVQGMLPYLNNEQIEKLQEVLQYTLVNYDVKEKQQQEKISEQNFVELFLSAKRIEGCSEKSLKYYKATIEAMLDELKKDVKLYWSSFFVTPCSINIYL